MTRALTLCCALCLLSARPAPAAGEDDAPEQEPQKPKPDPAKPAPEGQDRADLLKKTLEDPKSAKAMQDKGLQLPANLFGGTGAGKVMVKAVGDFKPGSRLEAVLMAFHGDGPANYPGGALKGQTEALGQKLGPGKYMLVVSPIAKEYSWGGPRGDAVGKNYLDMAQSLAAAGGNKDAGLMILGLSGGGKPLNDIIGYLAGGTPEAQAAAKNIVKFIDSEALASYSNKAQEAAVRRMFELYPNIKGDFYHGAGSSQFAYMQRYQERLAQAYGGDFKFGGSLELGDRFRFAPARDHFDTMRQGIVHALDGYEPDAAAKLAQRHIPASLPLLAANFDGLRDALAAGAAPIPLKPGPVPAFGQPPPAPAPAPSDLPQAMQERLDKLRDVVQSRAKDSVQAGMVERGKARYTPEQRALMEKYAFEKAASDITHTKEVSALVQYKDPRNPGLKVGEFIVWDRSGRELARVPASGSIPYANGAPAKPSSDPVVFNTNFEYAGQPSGPTGIRPGRDATWMNVVPGKYQDSTMIRVRENADGTTTALSGGANGVYDLHPGNRSGTSAGCWTMDAKTYAAFREAAKDLTDRSVVYEKDVPGGKEVGKTWSFLYGAREPDLGKLQAYLDAQTAWDKLAQRHVPAGPELRPAAPAPAEPGRAAPSFDGARVGVPAQVPVPSPVPEPQAPRAAPSPLEGSFKAARDALVEKVVKNLGGERIRSVVEKVMDDALAKGVPPAFALAIAKNESGFRQGAVSDAGARGVMQLMPGTARGLGVDPYDLSGNISGGVEYLRQQLEKFNGDFRLAAAAYNAGPGAVSRYDGVPPYAETRAYVERVLATMRSLGTPEDLTRLASAVVSPGTLPDAFDKTLRTLLARADVDRGAGIAFPRREAAPPSAPGFAPGRPPTAGLRGAKVPAWARASGPDVIGPDFDGRAQTPKAPEPGPVPAPRRPSRPAPPPADDDGPDAPPDVRPASMYWENAAEEYRRLYR